MKNITKFLIALATICSVVTGTKAQTITGSANVCVGYTTSLGIAGFSGTWSSTNAAVAAIDSISGVVTGVSPDTTTIIYILSGGSAITLQVTVNPVPSSIVGMNVVCAGGSTVLNDPDAGGAWSVDDTTIAGIDNNGVVTGVTGGAANITYAFGTGCLAIAPFTVNNPPQAISGSNSVCAGSVTAFNNATPGGNWNSYNASVASVNMGTGMVTGKTAGTTIISYELAGCSSVTFPVTVNPAPAAIAGTAGMCLGATANLSDATTGGTWSVDDTTLVQVTIGGGAMHLIGIAPGTTGITYTSAIGCTARKSATVNPLPAVISGAGTVCTGLTMGLSDSTMGGKWSSGNTSVATVGSLTGIVTGKSSGIACIKYTLASGCGIAVDTITVNPLPAAITGTAAACVGAATTLVDTTGSGNWSISNTAIAVTDSTGIVSGISAGTAAITYTIGTGCRVTKAVTIHALPVAISGAGSLCTGAMSTYSDVNGGGRWTSSNTLIATVNNVNGVVTAKTTGTVGIIYKLSTGCVITDSIIVNPAPSAIAGPAGICIGLATTLSNPVQGGVWSSSDSTVAAIDGTGTVTSVAIGTAVITYKVATGCMAKKTVSVNTLPNAITGPASICAVSTITFSDSSVGGKWSSGNTKIATVGISNGIVASGKSAGTVSITYKLATGCAMTTMVTINPLPSAIIGSTSICAGSTATLSNVVSGGNWVSNNTAIASIDSNSGALTAVSVGTAVVTYDPQNGCGVVTKGILVNAAPAGICGGTCICVGSAMTMSDCGGGKWNSGNTSLASVGAGTGIVTGKCTGTATISYILSTGCMTTKDITIMSGTGSKSSENDGSGTAEDKGAAVNNPAVLHAYPNPNTGVFYILLSSAAEEQGIMVISNIAGQKIMELPVTTNQPTQVNLNNQQLSGNIYIINVLTATGKSEAKIIVNR